LKGLHLIVGISITILMSSLASVSFRIMFRRRGTG
jgi:hypothetical protein